MRLKTQAPEILLQALSRNDADSVYALIQSNREHLTQRGDYTDLVNAPIEEICAGLEGDERTLEFGVFLDGTLVGSVSLINYQPTVFGLGYWIAKEHSGKGIMKAAVQTVVQHALKTGATEIWAGITPSNAPSIALVERLGFELARTQESHLSYRFVPNGGGT